MEKTQYEDLEIEVIAFEGEDIITLSGPDGDMEGDLT